MEKYMETMQGSDKLAARKLILEDTTLRDGEQAPGIAFDVQQKTQILDALIGAGVRWVEIGIPAMGGDELAAIKAMLERKDEANLVAWNRGNAADIRKSLDLGFRHVHIGLPTSDIHLKGSISKDRSWLLQRAAELVRMAKDSGAFVSISAEDVGRTEKAFLQEYAGVISEAGADRLRLSDTIGILSPAQYAAVVRSVAEVTAIDTQCHCHNDFGLAIANTLAGLEAGATYFHVCVNGMGERAGMPDLAATAMALHHFHCVDLGLQLQNLKALSELVARISNHACMPWYPVVGDNVFAHESGIHAKAMLADTHTFEPFMPEVVGGTRRYVIGKHSGTGIIRHMLLANGVQVEEDRLEDVLQAVRALSVRMGREVFPVELVTIYREQCALADSEMVKEG
jgi:homocitrate synthase NifV